MSRRSLSLMLDAATLPCFVALLSWRLTGVPLHERVAVGLLVALLTHLVIQWDWVETRVVQVIRDPSWRKRGSLLLNGVLFVTMGTVFVSGFAISKSLMPNTLSPGTFLTWHQVHDMSSNLTMVVIGLHVALNWDLIASGVRRAWRRRVTGGASDAVPKQPVMTLTLRRVSWVLLVSSVLAVAVRSAGALLPPQRTVVAISADGQMSVIPVPADIGGLRDDQKEPHFVAGVGRLLVQLTAVGAIALIGRKALRIRLA